jgi:KaiC/GvpD/RAD55 family RecA-like ATPase
VTLSPFEIADVLGVADLPQGKSRKVLSPLRDERTPSLNVKHTNDDDWLFKDHGFVGDTFEALREHFEGSTNGNAPHVRVTRSRSAIEATYDYVDERGKLLYQVVRYEDKRFKQRRKVKERYVDNLNGVRRVPYRLPEVLAAAKSGETVHVVEGEKDADAIVEAGGVATCNPGGAGKWLDEYASALEGADVVVVADRDERGRTHALEVKRSLLGAARSVHVVEALVGKDASDHLDAGHSLDELSPAERFTRMDLGAVIEDGIPEPEFVIPGVFYAGRAHAVMGEPGDGKTLVMLAFAVEVMKAGRDVAWFDEENGPAVIASRLVSLGATAQQVTQRFAYYPFSEPTLDDAIELAAEVSALTPALVVFDSGADMYVASGLNENDNMDMTRWATEFTQRLARAHGIASVVLEHVAKKGDDGYQRGAGAKKAKVDASWRLDVLTPFDHETVGEVELVRKKDRLAHLPPVLRFQIGGDGNGKTVFTPVEVEDVEEQRVADMRRKREAFRDQAIAVLRREGALSAESGLTQNVLTGLLPPGTQAFKNDVVQWAAADPTTPVRNARGQRNSIVYWLEEGESDD